MCHFVTEIHRENCSLTGKIRGILLSKMSGNHGCVSGHILALVPGESFPLQIVVVTIVMSQSTCFGVIFGDTVLHCGLWLILVF